MRFPPEEPEPERPLFQRYLVPEDKYEYVRNNRRQGAGGDRSVEKNCVFCSLAEGAPESENVVFSDEVLFCVLNLHPYNPGHLMVVPKRHHEALRELPPALLSRTFSLVVACQRVLLEHLEPTGFNIGVNEGANSGQSQTHLHVHVVPRYPNELGFIDVVGGTRAVPLTLSQVREELRPAFRAVRYEEESNTYEGGASEWR
ncbi:MAG: hypothetical protein Kow0069_02700 [Promethearchaeota archaeon]